MAINVMPSGKAPPGRLRVGASTVALATALPVAACGSHADNSAGPAAAGPHCTHVGERFLNLKMAEEYTPAPPEGGGMDEYRCQVIDPGLTKAAFLTGTQVMPENAAIAHHAIVYTLPPGDAAAVREHDAKTPGLGWQRFGGTGVAGAEVEPWDAAWVDTWARLVTTKGRSEKSCRRMPHGYRTTQTLEGRLT